jgi:hypothetical protein
MITIDKNGVNQVVKIIARRDGHSFEEALEIVTDTLAEVEVFLNEGDFLGAEEFWMSDLGLEPDYLMSCFGM